MFDISSRERYAFLRIVNEIDATAMTTTSSNLAKFLALNCVRNTCIEDHHAGIFPSSKTGDYSDVKVVSPYGEIPWNELSRISDQEMCEFNKSVTNQLFTALVFLEEQGYLPLNIFTMPEGWDEPSLFPDLYKKLLVASRYQASGHKVVAYPPQMPVRSAPLERDLSMYVPSILRASTELARLIAERVPSEFEGHSLEITTARIVGLFEGCVGQVIDVVDEQFPEDYEPQDYEGDDEDDDDVEQVLGSDGYDQTPLSETLDASDPQELNEHYASALKTLIRMMAGEETLLDPTFQELLTQHLSARDAGYHEGVSITPRYVAFNAKTLLAAHGVIKNWKPSVESETGEE